MFIPVFKKKKNKGREEQLAAIKIQATWRGKRQQKLFKHTKFQRIGNGYYTHTIVATEAPIDSSVPQHLKDIHSLQKSIYMLLEDPNSSKAAKVLQIIVLSTIVFSISCFVLETLPELRNVDKMVWWGLECLCTITFSLEFILRLYTCQVIGQTRLRFLTTPMNLADLFAIMPFYVEACVGNSAGNTGVLRVLRAVRLVRLFRIFKLGRHSRGMQVMAETLQNSFQALWVLIFFLLIGCILFSSLLYYLEKAKCPDTATMSRKDLDEYADHCAGEYASFYRGVSPKHGLCCNSDGAPEDFPSIISALWWSIVTMTTVGFGDKYPRTTLGKGVGFVAMLVGMILIAVPVAIVGNKFQEVYENYGDEEATQKSKKLMKMESMNPLAAEPNWKLMARGLNEELQDIIGDPAESLMSIAPMIDDIDMALKVKELAEQIKKSWGTRGQLRRDRRKTLAKQEEMTDKFDAFVEGIMNSWNPGSSANLGASKSSAALPAPAAQE